MERLRQLCLFDEFRAVFLVLVFLYYTAALSGGG